MIMIITYEDARPTLPSNLDDKTPAELMAPLPISNTNWLMVIMHDSYTLPIISIYISSAFLCICCSITFLGTFLFIYCSVTSLLLF